MKNKTSVIFSAVIIFLISVFVPALLNAEEITDPDFGWSLDVPEGFKVAGYTPDGLSYQFKHSMVPVEFVLRLYLKEEYQDTQHALARSLDKLSAEYEGIDSFRWNNTNASITAFSSRILGKSGAKGWSVCTELKKTEGYIVLLCYTDTEAAEALEAFLLSTLNSLDVFQNDRFCAGIITDYAYPATGQKNITLNIGQSRITTSVDKDSSEANQFVINSEYEVLFLYQKSPLWKEAWIRYYKAIYRDTRYRLQEVTTDIQKSLYPMAQKQNPKNPKAAYNELLLHWVQSFDYEHEEKDVTKSDFTDAISAMQGAGNDCDTRSLLMTAVLNLSGIKSVLFISREYSHAVYGADLMQDGAKIEVSGKEYLLNETTVKDLSPGLIHRDLSDTEKWIPVVVE